MHRLFSWTADAVGCWARLVVGVCSPFQKIDHDKSMVDYSAKCAPAFAPAHTIPIDIHHRHALTCDLRIPNPAWFRDSTDLFFHFFLSQPGRKACFYPPPPGLFFYGAPKVLVCTQIDTRQLTATVCGYPACPCVMGVHRRVCRRRLLLLLL